MLEAIRLEFGRAFRKLKSLFDPDSVLPYPCVCRVGSECGNTPSGLGCGFGSSSQGLGIPPGPLYTWAVSESVLALP